VRKQGLGCLLYGQIGNVLGHEVLTYGPVDEAAQSFPAVNVGRAEGGSDVVECVLVRFGQLTTFCSDVVLPFPDAGDCVIGCT
jgi:hypothetical protein